MYAVRLCAPVIDTFASGVADMPSQVSMVVESFRRSFFSRICPKRATPGCVVTWLVAALLLTTVNVSECSALSDASNGTLDPPLNADLAAPLTSADRDTSVSALDTLLDASAADVHPEPPVAHRGRSAATSYEIQSPKRSWLFGEHPRSDDRHALLGLAISAALLSAIGAAAGVRRLMRHRFDARWNRDVGGIEDLQLSQQSDRRRGGHLDRRFRAGRRVVRSKAGPQVKS